MWNLPGSFRRWIRYVRLVRKGLLRRKRRPIVNHAPQLETLEDRLAPAIRVAVVGVEATQADARNAGFLRIVNQLNDSSFSFTATLVKPSDVSTVGQFGSYDAVVIGNNGSDGSGVSAGDGFDTFIPALKSWVEAGGGVVAVGYTIFGAANESSGTKADLDAIVPVNVADGNGARSGGTITFETGQLSHAVINGLGASLSIPTGINVEYPSNQSVPGATLLATVPHLLSASQPQPAVVVGNPGSGRSIYLGPVYASVNAGDPNVASLSTSGSDADKLLEQAVAWAGTPPAPTLDFGDAPDTTAGTGTGDYQTTLANNGARHTATGPRLGTNRDTEADATANAAATGDDTTGTPNDEDGVTFLSTLTSATSATTASVVVNLQNADATNNKLDAWIDFNRDGDWADPNEQLFVTSQTLTSGDNTLTFMIPANVATGTTYARFRLSTVGSLAPTGAASDGEVEDYQVTITASGGTSAFSVPAGGGTVSTQISGGNLQVLKSSTVLYSAPASGITSFTINGRDNAADTLTVDATSFASGGFTGTILFNGGSGTGSDQVTLNGSTTFGSVAHTFVSNSDGSIQIDADGTGAGAPFTVQYTGLEPVNDNLMTDTRSFTFTGGDETITVTAGAAGTLNIDSNAAGEVVNNIPNPGVSLTISATNGTDTVTITSVDAGYRATTIITSDGGDTFNLNTALTLGSATAEGDFQVTAATINLNANVNTDDGGAVGGGDISLTGAVTLGANVVLDTDRTTGTDGNVSFVGASSTINGAQTLQVQSGDGSAAFNGVIGGTAALTSLTVNNSAGAGAITLAGLGGGAAGVTGATSVGNAATTGITFSGTTYHANAQTYTATAGLNLDLTAGATTTFTSSNDSISFSTATIDLANDSNLAVTSAGGAISAAQGVRANSNETVNLDAGVGTIDVGTIGGGNEILSVVLNATAGVTLRGNITTSSTSASNQVSITGTTTLTTDVTISTAAGNGAIALGPVAGTTNATESLALTAGSGTVGLGGTVGTAAIALEALSVTASGQITLGGNIFTDVVSGGTGNVSFSGGGNVVLSTSLTIDTEQGTNSNAGSVNLGTSAVSGSVANRDLSINTTTASTNTSGDITLAAVTTNILNLTANAANAGTGAAGDVTFTNSVTLASGGNLDADGKAISLTTTNSDLMVSGAGTATLDATVSIALASGSSIQAGAGGVALTSDSVAIDTAGTPATINVGANTATFRQFTNNTAINLGTESGGQLSLTDLELDRVTAGTISIGNTNSGAITVSDTIDRTAATDLSLTAGGSNSISFSGASATLHAGGGNVTLTTSQAGSAGVTSGSAATDVTANQLSVTAGSGGIGASGNPLTLSAATLVTHTDAATDGQQFLRNTGSALTWNTSTAGTTTIDLDGGRFNVGGSQTVTASTVNVNSTATLGGTGTVSGAVAVGSSGIVSPGTSPGVLNAGSTTFTGGTFSVDIEGASAGNTATDHDQHNVSGSVALGAGVAVLSLAGSYVPQAGDDFVIIANDGSTDDTTGFFMNLPEGSPLPSLFNGKQLWITYNGGDGNDVVLNTTPIANGTSGADTVIFRQVSGSPGVFEVSTDGGTSFVNLGAVTSFTFNGNGGNDRLTLDYANGDPIPGTGLAGEGIFYNGNGQTGTPGDVIEIRGTGTQAVTYQPSATTFGNGLFSVAGSGTINFTGLEPGDVVNVASFTLTTTNATNNDTITLANGTTAVGGLPAIVVSGDSGGVAFENARLRQVGLITIDAATNDSAGFTDVITITSADNAHLNGALAISTAGATDRVNLNGNVLIDGSFTLSGVEHVVAGASSITLDTEQSEDGNGGNVDLGGAVVSATVNNVALSISTATASGSAAGGNVSLGAFGSAPGGNFVRNLSIDTNAATDGTVTLNGSVVLDDNGTGTQASLTISGGGTVVVANDLSIDLSSSTAGTSGGAVDFGGSSIRADVAGRDLTIDTSHSGASSGGNVSNLAGINGTGGAFLESVFVTTLSASSTAGTLELEGSILVDEDGAAPPSPGVEIRGLVAVATDVTIDTNQTAGRNAALIDLDRAVIGATASGVDLVLDTSASGAGNAANQRLGDVTDPDGVGATFQQLRSLTVDVRATGSGTAGTLTLDDGDGAATTTLLDVQNFVSFTNAASVVLGDHVSIDTDPAGAGEGNVSFAATGSITGANRNLTITADDGGAGGTDGNVQLPNTIGASGTPIGTLSVTADTGTITLGGGATTYHTSAITYGSTVVLTGDTVQNTNGGNFTSSGDTFVSGTGTGGPHTLAIDTTDPTAANAAGNVTLGAFDTSGGADGFVAAVSIDANDAGAALGDLILTANISLDHDGTAPANFTFDGDDVRVDASLTIDTDASNDEAGGAINLNVSGGSDIAASAAGFTLTLDSQGTTGGAITLGTVSNTGLGTQYLTSLMANADGATDGTVTLGGNINVDGGAVTLTGLVRLPASRMIDTEQGDDGTAGSVTLAAASGSVSATAADVDLTINTAGGTTGGGPFHGGAVSLGLFNSSGSNFVNDVAITTTAGAGGTAGSLTLNANVSLDFGTDAADFTLAGGGNVLVAANAMIDTEDGDNANAGNISLGAGNVSASAMGLTLTLNAATASGSGTGGNISFGPVNSTGGGQFLQSLVATSDAATDGTLTPGGDISVDGGAVTLTGLVRLAASRTIDTEQGNDGTAGAVTLAVASGNVSATAADVDLTINTAGGAGTGPLHGGNVSLGLFNSSGGNLVNDVAITTTAGTAGTAGSLTLNANVSLDFGTDAADFTLTGGGNVLVNTAAVTIDTEDGGNDNGGAINLGTGNVAGTAANRVLVLDASGSPNGGAVTLGSVGDNGGSNNFLARFSATTNGTGQVNLSSNVFTDDTSAGAVATPGVQLAGRVAVSQDAQIDTAQGGNTTGSPIDLSAATVFANGSNIDVDLVTSAATTGGAVSLGTFDNTDSTGFINTLDVNTNGGTTDGSITLNASLALDDNGTGTASALTFSGGGTVVVANDLSIDLSSSTAGTSGGAVDFGGSSIRADVAGRDLTIDTSHSGASSGGNVSNLAGINGTGGAFLESVLVTTLSASSTAGTLELEGSILVDEDGAAPPSPGVEIRGLVALATDVTIDTNQTAGRNAAVIDLDQAVVGATGPGVDLVLDTSASGVGNAANQRLGDVTDPDGVGATFQQLRSLTVDVRATGSGTAGTLTLDDGDGAGTTTLLDVQNFVSFTNAASVVLSDHVSIDTDPAGAGEGNVSFAATGSITGAGRNLTITVNDGTAGGGSDGNVQLPSTIGASGTPIGTLSVTADTGTITLGGGATTYHTSAITYGSTVVLTGDTIQNTNGGNFTSSGDTFVSGAATGGPHTLGIDTTDPTAANAAGNVTLGAFDTSGGADGFVAAVSIDANDGGAALGDLILTANISLDHDGTAPANFTFDGDDVEVLGASVEIDTEQGDDEVGGTVNLGTTSDIAASVAGLTLTLDARGSVGGDVTFGPASNTGLGGQFLGGFVAQTNGAGRINLDNNVTTDGTTGVTLLGLVEVGAATVTVHTAGLNTSQAGGIDLSGAAVFGDAANRVLNLSTATTNAAASGAVSLGLFSNNSGAGSFLQTVDINGTNSGAGADSNLVLGGNVSLDGTGQFRLQGGGNALVNAASVTIDTEQGGDDTGGVIDLGTGNVAGMGANRVLVLDASGSPNGGAVTFGPVGDNGTANSFLARFSATTNGTGQINLPSSVFTDDTSAGAVATPGVQLAGRVAVSQDVQIDTAQGANATGSPINLSGATVYANGTNIDVDLLTNAATTGGAVSLGTFDNTGGTGFVSTLDVNTNGGTTDGTVTLNASVALDDNGTATPSALTFTGGGDVIVASSLSIDLTSATDGTTAGSIDFGGATVSASTTGFNLTLNTSHSDAGDNGGNVSNLASVTDDGRSFLDTLAINLLGGVGGTAGTLSFSVASPTLDVNGTAATQASIGLDIQGNVTVPAGTLSLRTHPGGTPHNSFAIDTTQTAFNGTGTLVLDTSGGNTATNAGHVTLGDLGTTTRLTGVTVDTRGSTTSGTLTLDNGVTGDTTINISTGSVNFTNAATVVLGDHVSIDSNPTGAGEGNVNFAATGSITGAGRNLTITVNDGTAGGGNDGNVQLPSTIGASGTPIGTLSVTADTGSITLGGGATTYHTSAITYGSTVVLTGDTVQNTNGGNFTSSGDTFVSGAATGGPHTLAIDTTDPTATNAAGNVTLGAFDTSGGADGFVAAVSIDANDGGAALGDLILTANINLDHDGTAPANFTFDGDDVRVDASLTIDTDFGNDEAGGAINLNASGASEIAANAAGFTLTLDSRGTTGGAITLGTVSNTGLGTQFLTSLVANADGTTDGTVTLDGNINVDSGAVTLTGLVRLSGSRVIDTEQGDDGSAGAVTLAVASGDVSATASGADLTINTAGGTGAGPFDGGNVSLGLFNSSGGSFVNDVAITTTAGTGGSAGSLTLNANVSLDFGTEAADFTLTGGGDVRVTTNVTIDTEDNDDANAGNINLGTGNVSATGTGLTLMLNAATSVGAGVGGNVTFGNVNGTSGQFLQSFQVTADAITDGQINPSSAISVEGGLVSLTGNTRLATSLTIDTDQDAVGNPGNVTLAGAGVSATTLSVNLSINANTTTAGTTGGTVNVNAPLDNVGGGQFVNNLSIDADGATNGNVNVTSAVQTAGSVLIDNTALTDLDASVTAGTSLTIQNVTTEVDLDTGVNLTAQNGNVDVNNAVTAIDLSGTGTNVVTATTGTVELAAVSDSAAVVEFEINAAEDVTLSTVTINNDATNNAVGLLDINVDTDNDGGTFTSGVLVANDVTIDSNNDLSIGSNITATSNNSAIGIQLTTVDSLAESEDITIQASVTLTASGTSGDIRIRAGDDILITADSDVDAADNITLHGDFGSADAGTGATINISAELTGATLLVNGDTDADTLQIVESAGNNLPALTGDATAIGGHTNATFTARVGTTALGPDNIGAHFEAGGGSDALEVTLSASRHVLYMPDTNEANSGVITFSSALSLSFDSLSPVTLIGGGGGDLLVDASAIAAVANLTIQDVGGPADSVNLVDGDDVFEDVTFSGYQRLLVVGGSGVETIDLVSLDVGSSSPLTQVVLDGDNAAQDDASADILRVRSLPATVNVTLLGGGGGDSFVLDSDPTATVGAADDSVDTIAGQVVVSQAVAGSGAIPAGLAEEMSGGDSLSIQDTDDTTGDTVLVTATAITGATGAEGITGYTGGGDEITYNSGGDLIETVTIFSSNTGGDTFNVQATTTGTTYTLHTQGGNDTINVGSTAPTLGTSVLDAIDGQLNLNTGLGDDALNVSDQGDTAGDTYSLMLNAGTTELNFGDGDGTATPDIVYNANGTAQLEDFLLTGSATGNNTYTIANTTATETNTITDGDAGLGTSGNGQFTIQANNLQGGAANTYHGLNGNDTFDVNFASNTSISATASTTFVLNGGASATRDVVNLGLTADTVARTVGFTYASGSSGDVDITGLGLPTFLDVNTVEQLNYRGDTTNNNDVLTVNGTTGDDTLSVTPISASEANVFLGGTPLLTIPAGAPGANNPGVAGGSTGPDLSLRGLAQATGLTVAGGGAGGSGDRMIVNAPTEALNGADTTSAWAGNGFGSATTVRTAGNAFDDITVTQNAVAITNFTSAGVGTALVQVNLTAASFNRASAAEAELTVNTGEETGTRAFGAGIGTVADDLTVTLSTAFRFQINAGAPALPGTAPLVGDRLNVVTPTEANIFSDTNSPPNVSVTSTISGTPTAPVTFHNVELLLVTSGNGVVNVLGDNNTATPQADSILVLGQDVDASLGGGDFDGANEFRLVLNGSTPIGVRNVGFLNVMGMGGDDDVTLDPYADSVRSWGISTAVDGGAGDDDIHYGNITPNVFADPTPNGSVNTVSEAIVVAPSTTMGAGQIQVPGVVTVVFTNAEDLSFFVNNGTGGDTDTLTIRGTNSGDTMTANLQAAGTDAAPLVDIDLTAPATQLVQIERFAVATPVSNMAPTLSALPLVTLELLNGDDTLSLTPGTTTEVNADGGSPTNAPGDTLDLLLGGATSPSLTVTAGPPSYSGTHTFGNRAAVNFASFETITPTVSITATDPSAAEPSDTGTFTVTRTGDTSASLTVNYTINGTASNGTDYTLLTGTVVIPATSSSAVITITPSDDTTFEGSETVTVSLAAGAYAIGSSNSDTVTIADNEAAPTLSIDDVTVTETDAGTVSAVFTVTLSNASTQTVAVDFATSNSTAFAPGDYQTTGSTLTFSPGQISKTITVFVNSDLLVEASENYFVNLFNASNATVADGQGLGTITDNDTATFTIDNVTRNESDGTMTFTVSLSNPIDTTAKVNVSFADVSTSAGDFAHATQQVTFAANSTTAQTVTLAITDDGTAEAPETFTASLALDASTPLTGRARDLSDTGTGTITDNDTATFTIGDVSVSEATGTLTFTIALSTPIDTTAKVNVSYTDQTATGGGTDYDSATDQVTFAANSTTSQMVTVAINNDNIVEAAEMFLAGLALDGTTPLTGYLTNLTDTATGGITNDDTATLTISTTPATVAEGDAGNTPVTYTVSVDKAVAGGFTVAFGTSGTAGGSDFSVVTGSPLTFTGTVGESRDITVNIAGDLVMEGNETIVITLGTVTPTNVNVNAANIVTSAAATKTILDNEIDLRVTKTESVDPVPAGSGAGNLTYVVTVANVGLTDATGVTLSEAITLPAGVTIVSITPSGGSTYAPPNNANGTWTVGNLAVGASRTLTVVLTADGTTVPGTNVISDTAAVTASNENRVNTGDDSTTVSTSVVRSVDLTLAKTDNQQIARPGDTLVYTLTYGNLGPSPATNVVITETLPANTLFDPANVGWVNAGGGQFTFNVGALAAGTINQTATFRVIVVNPLPAGAHIATNVATIADGGGAVELTPANNTATDTTTLNVRPTAQPSRYTMRRNRRLRVNAQRGLLSSLAGAFDANGDALTAVLLRAPSKGRLTLRSDGSFDYRPKRGFSGAVTFSYRVFDGFEFSDPIDVTIMVRPRS